MRFTLLGFSLLLAACSGHSDGGRARIETAPAIVAAPCVTATGRPTPVTPLRQGTPVATWEALAPGAKARAVQAQAGRRMSYIDSLEAATAGCP